MTFELAAFQSTISQTARMARLTGCNAQADLLERIGRDPWLTHESEIWSRLCIDGIHYASAVCKIAESVLPRCQDFFIRTYVPEGEPCQECEGDGALEHPDRPIESVAFSVCSKCEGTGSATYWSCTYCGHSYDVGEEAGGYELVRTENQLPLYRFEVCRSCADNLLTYMTHVSRTRRARS